MKALLRTRRNVVPVVAETVRRPVNPIMLNAFVRGLLMGLLPLAGSVALVAGSAPDASARLPVILRQPISQGVYAGDTVSLSVVAVPPSSEPSAALSYQWLVGTNQTPIAVGAYNSTNTTLSQLVLTNVATGYSGLFRVAVTSGTNTVVSEPAQLSVVLGVASQLRLGTVSVSTLSGAEAVCQVPIEVRFHSAGAGSGRVFAGSIPRDEPISRLATFRRGRHGRPCACGCWSDWRSRSVGHPR